MNRVGKWNSQIEKSIDKFDVGEKEKNDFIAWLSSDKYNAHRESELAGLIGFRGDIS